MGENKDLAEKIYWILIEEGQHNLKFPLGSMITNTPGEVRDIVRKHIKELQTMSEYEKGYQAFIEHKPFRAGMPREWKAGYLHACYENDTLPHW